MNPSANPPVRVRRARRSDGPRILELQRALAIFEKLRPANRGEARRLLAMLFDSRELEAFVAMLRGRIEGVALFWEGLGSSLRMRPFLFLADLVVSESARGAGVGEALMTALAREGVKRKALRIDWEVLDWNVNAIRFYRRLGGRRRRTDWLRYALDEKAMRTLALRGTRANRSGRPRDP